MTIETNETTIQRIVASLGYDAVEQEDGTYLVRVPDAEDSVLDGIESTIAQALPTCGVEWTGNASGDDWDLSISPCEEETMETTLPHRIITTAVNGHYSHAAWVDGWAAPHARANTDSPEPPAWLVHGRAGVDEYGGAVWERHRCRVRQQ